MFKDQCTKFLFVDLLKAKSEALASLKEFVLCGNAREVEKRQCKGTSLKMYCCLDAGILQEKTRLKTPQQNGLAERCNRTLLEMARCLLIDLGLPKMMWRAAILHATRTGNYAVRREQKCPVELMPGMKPKISVCKISIFVCTDFMRKMDRDVSKLEPRILEKFEGYTERHNGYLVYVPNTQERW